MGGTSRVAAHVLVDSRLYGTGPFHSAIRAAMGGVRTQRELSGTGGVLVAKLAGRGSAIVLRDFPPRCGHRHGTRDGASRLCAKPDLGRQSQADSNPDWSAATFAVHSETRLKLLLYLVGDLVQLKAQARDPTIASRLHRYPGHA